MQNILSVSGLDYGNVRNVSFELPRSGSLGLFGENDSGRSAVVRLVLGMIRRLGGEISIAENTSVGAVVAGAGFPGSMTLSQIGRMLGMIHDSWDGGKYSALLAEMELGEKVKAGALNTDGQMRLAFCAAMARRTDLLVVDCPPDCPSWVGGRVMSYLKETGGSVLLSARSAADVACCDRAGLMYAGSLLFCDSVRTLKEMYRVITLDEKEMQTVNRRKLIGARRTASGTKALVRREDFKENRFNLSEPTLAQIAGCFVRREEARNARFGL